uniref:Uncharacterized protein n=1 Tax=Amphimedon queenslandica TaxID=400682 RepID=A0A1X7SY62_AMPQE
MAASYLNLLSSVSKRLPLLHQPCVSVTRRLFSSEISDLFCSVFDKEYKYQWSVSEYNLKEDRVQLKLLKNLKERGLTELSDENHHHHDIKYLELKYEPSGDPSDTRNPYRFLYVRNFYNRLFEAMWANRGNVLLLGNPGVSKSWFQWYIMYRLVNRKERVHLSNPPTVIARQLGNDSLTFFFPDKDKVYTSEISFDTRILKRLDSRKAVYLYDPYSVKQEPLITHLKTVVTCSPNRKHYHEFRKRGVSTLYMPQWELDELQAVACHIKGESGDDMKDLLSPEQVEERYYRYGGIIRYVIPSDPASLEDTELLQKDALSNRSTTDLFLPGASIEKRDESKRNISHFLLQYVVSFHKKGELDKKEFRHFRMELASQYVREEVSQKQLTTNQFQKVLGYVQEMFLGAGKQRPDVFELLVLQALLKDDMDWRVVSCDEESARGKKNVRPVSEWPKWKPNLTKLVHLQKGNESHLELDCNTLYVPRDYGFPGIDMFWIEEK